MAAPTARTSTRSRKPAIDSVQISEELTVPVGSFVKRGTRRLGTAMLTVQADGTLLYTNRRGEQVQIDDKRFLQVWKSGINSLVA